MEKRLHPRRGIAVALAALTLRPEGKTVASFSGVALMKSEGGGIAHLNPKP